ncbi:glutathione S-transferase-like protein [Mycena maculata]|uniref:glutathione transferase n=1 Tax=Mycena maculata TaxID=230809 RepID=A0AAD7HBM2_9AGAR|nr:glutathione S-transferase-like protein [Mycena maculata]
MLKLYGFHSSTCVRRVATVLLEKQVPFEFVDIDLATAEHKSGAFLEHQPFGQVPYIEDDGLILYESRAICRYIVEKYPTHGPQLVPTDIIGRALFEQAASIEYCNFDPFCSGAVAEMIFKPMGGHPHSKEVFDKLVKSLSAKLDGYEVILGKQRYLAGDELTLADLFHLPYGFMLAQAGSDLMTTKGPNVARYAPSQIAFCSPLAFRLLRWFKELCERDSWALVKETVRTIPSVRAQMLIEGKEV